MELKKALEDGKKVYEEIYGEIVGNEHREQAIKIGISLFIQSNETVKSNNNGTGNLPATDKQKKYLEGLKVVFGEKITRAEANKLISENKK